MNTLTRASILLLAGLTLASAQQVYWLESGFNSPRLMRSSIAGVVTDSTALTSGSLPQQLAAGSTTRKLIWGELKYRSARALTIPENFSTAAVLVADSLSSIRGIAVYEDSGKAYWTSTDLATGSKIMMSDSKGIRQTVVSFPAGSNDAPFGLVFNPSNKKLYWTNFPAGKIQSADAVASATVTDLVTGLSGPIGIAIDVKNSRVYWAEANGNRIQSSDLNGTTVTSILTGLSRPTYLTLDSTGGKLYWCETQPGSIQSANVNGTGKALFHTANFPSGITMLRAATGILDPNSKQNASYSFSVGGLQKNAGIWNIRLSLPTTAVVEFNALDLLGKPVATLLNAERPAGFQTLPVESSILPSGVYLLKLNAGKFTATRCCIIQQ